ncbi:hypothetical protein [Marinomonas sp. CT5]|uniref:COG4315 family predicted lipoprotein n=1 Tax=Marinomonas sp. CT5 TaxID=2066133 RepID=UPI001BAEA949|nr:hypothetical protein [Marinomonas sp. CT5]
MKLQYKAVAMGVAVLLAPVMSSTAYAANLLTDKSGMTLYTFDKDSEDKSNCYDVCAAKWPPFIANKNAKGKQGFGVIDREDGTKQWTYKGQPLYTWSGDKKKGDTKGDGLGGVWHIATKPSSSY